MSDIVRLTAILTAATCASACHKHSTPPQPSLPKPVHIVAGCSPLASDQCTTPFPSSWFEQASPTATGESVIFPDGTLPRSSQGNAISQSSFGPLDGFSPATQLVVYFPQGVDPSQLVPVSDPSSSVENSAPIALVDLQSGSRLAYFSELDANASPDAGQRQALLIHPLARLQHSHRYGVGISNALRDAQGQPLAPEGQMAQWVANQLPVDAGLYQISDRLDAVAQALGPVGIARSAIVLAWDFDTGSEGQATDHLVQMRDQVLAAAPQGLSYQVLSVMQEDGGFDAGSDTWPDGGLGALRVIDGTFQSPSFEVGPDPSLLNVAPDGGVIMGAPAAWNFTAVVPFCAQDAGSVPLLIIGHGLFDTAHSELMDDRPLLEDLCMVGVGADWLGVTSNDVLVIAEVLANANQFGLVTDRLQQAHANFQVLTRLAMNALRTDPALETGDRPFYDPSQIYYWGASNGGIQGATYLALSPDVPRGVLNVPGAVWSVLIWRSSHFSDGLLVLDSNYPDKVDQQVLIAFSQSLWDRTDPIEFAPHLADPLPGVPVKQALFQESEGDAQVSNIATQMEMRSVPAVGLSPLLSPVYGLSTASAPLSGVIYDQWTVDPSPLPPPGNVPPMDNAAHQSCRWLPEVMEQTRAFLSPNGSVQQTCDGACAFAVPDGGD